jgi:hypothetical protein
MMGIVMLRTCVLLGLVACRSASPTPVPSNTVTTPPTEPIDAPEPTVCDRYAAVSKAIDACTALTEEQRQQIEQVRIDDMAAISEDGLDGTEVDRDALCESSLAFALKVAQVPCRL